MRYRDYTIKPYCLPYVKFEFWHDDYDGPGDPRCGLANTISTNVLRPHRRAKDS